MVKRGASRLTPMSSGVVHITLEASVVSCEKKVTGNLDMPDVLSHETRDRRFLMSAEKAGDEEQGVPEGVCV